MSYKESKKTLDNLRARKDETVFRMAISHLMDVGIRHLDEESCKHTCQGIMQHDDSRAIMTNDFMCEIVWTAHELSKVSHIDLLIYIQHEVWLGEAEVGQPDYQRALQIIRNCLCDADYYFGSYGSDSIATLQKLRDVGLTDDEIAYFGWEHLFDTEEEE